jgi:hypothetical protein
MKGELEEHFTFRLCVCFPNLSSMVGTSRGDGLEACVREKNTPLVVEKGMVDLG